MINKKIEYVWVSKLEISNRLKMNAIKKLGGINKFYNASIDDLVYLEFDDAIIMKVLDYNLKQRAIMEYEYMRKNNIDIISIEDDIYPQKLRLIQDNPICLYYRGNVGILSEFSIAIVGARKACKESLVFSRKVAEIMSYNGINVISGLAIGIDKYAHLGCLDVNNGKTIAVLGSGIDDNTIYPFQNKRVFDRIINNGGVVLSEYPLKTKPLCYNFPYRNRIVSGLSNCVMIVQASKKSGSLITANLAMQQSKDIYVYNSKNIDKDYFSGNRFLIDIIKNGN